MQVVKKKAEVLIADSERKKEVRQRKWMESAEIHLVDNIQIDCGP